MISPDVYDLFSKVGMVGVTMIGAPWCIWVTTSIFNQRQEIALLKQILGILSQKTKMKQEI